MKEKSLHNTDSNGARKNVSDIKFWPEDGSGSDMFRLICKASSESEGWMKSTKAMKTDTGVLVQTTTQQRNADGTYAIADALEFIPGETVIDQYTDGKCVARVIGLQD